MPNILILPTLGCVLAWLMASRPIVVRNLSVCVKSLKLQREVIAEVQKIRSQGSEMSVKVGCSVFSTTLGISVLSELIGFKLVADSSLRWPEGFDSEVGWEGTSGVVVIF